MYKLSSIALLIIVAIPVAFAQQAQAPAEATPAVQSKTVPENKPAEDSLVIPKGAKLFIASMPDKFDEYLKAAIQKKRVPATVVENRDQADFEITGHSETQKAGAAKIILMGSWHSRETASIKVANLKSGVISFAYSYDTNNSTHGKKTSSEACAKHLKEKIESGK
jgi:hypothetical protein